MNHRTAVNRLQSAISRPLPGVAAQLLMAPRTPSGAPLHGERVPGPTARQAAGLVLVFPSDEETATFVLTERSLDLPAHPGQIGLPAGMKDESETYESAALREAQEEIGVESMDVRVVGPLTPVYIPPSGILLHPFLAHLPSRPTFRPSANEVTRIFEVPLAALLDPASVREESRVLQGREALVPYFAFAGEKIWGATAMVLAEVRALLEERNPDDITANLADLSRGDPRAIERVLPAVYEEMRRLAAGYLKNERPGHTLQPTALAHEAFLRMVVQTDVTWQNRAHFLGVAAQAMRRILVDHARRRKALRRGGGQTVIGLDGEMGSGRHDVAFDDLDQALNDLAERSERQAKVVELRYFGGLTIEETAEVLGTSPMTVKRDWTMARAWLFRELGDPESTS